MKIKLIDFSFLLLLVGSFFSQYVMYKEKGSLSISIGIFLISAMIVLLVILFKKDYVTTSFFKVLNIICFIAFNIWGFLLTLILLYASPDEYSHPIESSFFLFTAIISSSMIFLYMNNYDSKWKAFFLLFYFLIVLIFSISGANLYTFASIDVIARPILTASIYFAISLFIYLTSWYIKNISFKLIKNIYMILIVLTIILTVNVAVSIYTNFNNNFGIFYILFSVASILNIFTLINIKKPVKVKL